MTNLYVSGQGLGSFATLTSSNTLIYADKITKSFKKIRERGTFCLDENNNLYADLTGTTLIDTDVEDIFTGKSYLKNNTLYIFKNNTYIAFQDQIKELLYVSSSYLVWNDFNDKTRIRYFDDSRNILYTYHFKEFFNSTYPLGLRDDGSICFALSSIYDLTRVSQVTNVEHLLPFESYGSGNYSYPWCIIDGKVAELREYTSNQSVILRNSNILNMADDEYVEHYAPNKERMASNNSTPSYVIKTNKQTYINSSLLGGIDGEYILDVYFYKSGSNSIYLVCTSLIEYPVTIYNKDNETIATTANVLPVNYASISVEDNTAVLTLHTVTDTNYSIAFTIEKPKGYAFSGLSLLPNATEPDITLTGNIFLSAQPLQLYQVYQKALPPDAVQATLYFNSAEPNRINKRNFLTKYKDIVGVFRSSVSIEDPVLVLELDEFPSFNYVYIKNFNRYYFVTGRDNISKNIYSLSLHIDPLYSFMDEISLQYADILRTSLNSLQNAYLNDPEQPIKNNKIIEIIESDVEAFDYNTSTGQYWLDAYRYIVTVNRGIALKAISDVLE